MGLSDPELRLQMPTDTVARRATWAIKGKEGSIKKNVVLEVLEP